MDRIISGGQTGADQAGWRAAKAASLSTGGYMPLGFLTEDGPRPEYAELYGMEQHTKWSYSARTEANVRRCDMVLVLATNMHSAGTKLTLDLAAGKRVRGLRRPYFFIKLQPPRAGAGFSVSEEALFAACAKIQAVALHYGRPIRLMAAGNRESTCPGIQAFAEGVMAMILDGC